jgi:cell filamentation protein
MFSQYDVYTEVNSKYCYHESNVLRNKLDIHDGEQLKQAETDIVAVKQHYLLTHPINGRFTANHLCRIHEFLFSDVYRFAGHYRTETIKKGSTTFLSENNISCKMKELLDKLKKEQFLSNMQTAFFINRLTYYFSELNYIHPFREGNGRTTREFIRELILYNGYEIDWGKVKTEALLDAMIASVYDTAELEQVLKICIHKIEE